ncbi:MAG: sensor histidine kinase [bacterium]
MSTFNFLRSIECVLRGVAGLCILTYACGISAGVQITGVTVDGKTMAPVGVQDATGDALRPLRIRDSARELTFRFAEEPFIGAPAARLRYKLEGIDKGWHDLPQTMRILLHFYDKKHQLIVQTEFPLEGETPGWTGSPQTADYVLRRNQVVVPERADSVKIAFVSHGGVVAVGIVCVDAIKVQVERLGEKIAIHDLSIIQVTDATRPADKETNQNWMREGSRLDIARMDTRLRPVPHPVLVLDDDDAVNYGNWSLAAAFPICPGDRLTVECLIAYSIGSSGPGEAHYTSLNSGNYTFRVAAFRSNGEATGVECAWPVVVTPALYRRSEFWWVLVALAIAIAALVARTVEVMRNRRRLELMAHEQVLERERARIAQDIHDDIGATLTEIGFLGDLVTAQDLPQDEQRRQVGEMTGKVRELVQKLDEIVWAMNPHYDSASSLANYFCGYAQRFLQAVSIACRLDRPTDLPDVPLTAHQRHSLFLAFKEALNNAVRHSGATEVWVRLRVEESRLEIVIEDNGQGLPDPEALRVTEGSGLHGMKERLASIQGQCEITSSAGKGTSVRFTVSIEQQKQ